jgi:hypothetical protein
MDKFLEGIASSNFFFLSLFWREKKEKKKKKAMPLKLRLGFFLLKIPINPLQNHLTPILDRK